MGVPRAFRALQRAARALPSAGGGAGSCGGPVHAPPCAPPGPRAPLPCRGRSPAPQRGVRVVCCPPRHAPAPACVPARATLTCERVTPQNCDSTQRRSPTPTTGGQDSVARRLQCAKRSRQLDYEREVTERAAGPPPPRDPPPAPYLMGNERELARATDGRLYALPRQCTSRPPCSDDGTPPPPRIVTLEEPEHACRVGDRRDVDPCAHQPRVFLEIDRRATSGPPASPSGVASHDPPTLPRRPVDSEEGWCSRQSRDGGRHIDDFGWCSKPLSPPNTPQRCRPLTIVERLQGRSPRSAPGGFKSGERRLHTSMTTGVSSVEAILHKKEQQKEAGRGCGVILACKPHMHVHRQATATGNFKLQVPPGTSKVRLQVFLDNGDSSPRANSPVARSGSCSTRPTMSCSKLTVACKSKNSWLSIKNIH